MKTIKTIGTALLAGLAFSIAVAAETGLPPKSDLQIAFEAASLKPAPLRPLYTPAIEPLAREIFAQNDVVIIGELHHNTNYKFLADNPAFFREAARNGVKSVYIELPTQLLPATEDYFTDRMSGSEFESAVLDHFKNIWTQWGNNDNRDYADQYIALCKTAKQYGITIRPTDFRMDSDSIMTSDAYGIPDIEERDDTVRALTLKTLELYTARTGLSRPRTWDDLVEFKRLCLELLKALPDGQRDEWYRGKSERMRTWSAHSASDETLAAWQNELQARYIARMPHEKKIVFIGGGRHFVQKGSTGDYAQKNGYKKVAGIELIAENGTIWRSGLEDPESIKTRQNGHQYQYRIRTDLGEITRLVPPEQKLTKSKSPG